MNSFDASVNQTDECADWRLAAARAALVYECRVAANAEMPEPLGRNMHWEVELNTDPYYGTTCGPYKTPQLYSRIASVIGPRFNSSAPVVGSSSSALGTIIHVSGVISSFPFIGSKTAREVVRFKQGMPFSFQYSVNFDDWSSLKLLGLVPYHQTGYLRWHLY